MRKNTCTVTENSSAVLSYDHKAHRLEFFPFIDYSLSHSVPWSSEVKKESNNQDRIRETILSKIFQAFFL